MKFAVLREHIGDKFYKEGDIRDADELTVKNLVRNGVLRPISDEKTSSTNSIEQLQDAPTADGNALATATENANPDDGGTVGDQSGVTTEAGAVQTEVLAAVTQNGSVSAGKSDDKAELNKAEGSAPKNKAK